MTNNNMTLFDEIYSHFGNECHCGGDALKCDDECCPESGMCLKSVLTKLKTSLDELKSIKSDEKIVCDECGFSSTDERRFDYTKKSLCNFCWEPNRSGE